MADVNLDCKGLNCPIPIVKISKAVKKLNTGQTLFVEATDPAFEADVRAWSKKTKNPIVEFNAGDVMTAVIQSK